MLENLVIFLGACVIIGSVFTAMALVSDFLTPLLRRKP